MKSLQKFIKESLEESHEDMIFEMANISKNTTGLPYIVWIQTKSVGNHGNHNIPRIKVQNGDRERIPVSIEDVPRILGKKSLKDTGWTASEFKKIQNWVIANQCNLLKHWNGEMTSDEFIFGIIKS